MAAPDPFRARQSQLPNGAYESYFIRANSPDGLHAFWVRYTMFRPRGRPKDAIGEVWAILFDGDRGEHFAARSQFKWDQCEFSSDRLDARLPGAALTPNQASGEIAGTLTWSLNMDAGGPPLYLFPERLYEGGFPAAKSLVVKPLCNFNGEFKLQGRRIVVDGWTGSLNHNWGTRHTDRYAWGQVAGFDGAPATFLEVASAWLKIGPLWTPPLTLIVLRHAGRTIAMNGLLRSARARVASKDFDWRFSAKDDTWEIDGHFSAARADFVGLAYGNPPGGVKHCLNTKIARSEVTLRDRASGSVEKLMSGNRAAFEILTDPRQHGVPIVAGYGLD